MINITDGHSCDVSNSRFKCDDDSFSTLLSQYRKSNIISIVSGLHAPQKFQVETRLATFNDWPPSIPVKPQELAEAGFYYTGRNDTVECFACGGRVQRWIKGDIPWVEHVRHHPFCVYLVWCKGREFIMNNFSPGGDPDDDGYDTVF